MAENNGGGLVIKEEKRSPCGCARNKDKFEDMELGSPGEICSQDIKDLSLHCQGQGAGKPFASSSGSLSQIMNQLPSSFDPLPDINNSPTAGFISQSARLGKKRPLSISPLSSSSINIDALVRGSPSSLINFFSHSRGSSAGSFGHLSPGSLFSSSSAYNQYNKPAISLSKAVHPSYPRSNNEKSLFPRKDSMDEQEEKPTEENDHGMKLEFVDIPSDHDAAYLQPRLMFDQETVFPEIDEHVELGQTADYSIIDEAKSNSKTSNRVKRIYYAYPAVETPHNNKCMWHGCERQCESLEELVTHVNTEHIYQDSRKEFVCRWEGCVRDERAFKAQYMLLVHMRRHTGEKPHKCHYDGCEKAYSRLENLKTHLRSHTGEKPYLCKYDGCGKAFSNASDCAKHMNRTHSDEKPYGCLNPGCNKRYTDPSSRRKHMKNCQINKKARVGNTDSTSGTEESAMETTTQPQPAPSSSQKKSVKNRKNERKKKPEEEKMLSPLHGPGSNHSQGLDLGYLSGGSQCTPGMVATGSTGNPPIGHTPLSGYNSSGYDTEYPSLPEDHGIPSLIPVRNSQTEQLYDTQGNHGVKTEPFSPPSQGRDIVLGHLPSSYPPSYISMHNRRYQPTNLQTLPEIIGPTRGIHDLNRSGHTSNFPRNRGLHETFSSGYSSFVGSPNHISGLASDDASMISGSSGHHQSLRSSDLSSSSRSSFSTLSSRLSSPTSSYRRGDSFEAISQTNHSMKPPDHILKPSPFQGLQISDMKHMPRHPYYSDEASVRSSHSSKISEYSDDFHPQSSFISPHPSALHEIHPNEFSPQQPLPPIPSQPDFSQMNTSQSQSMTMGFEPSQYLPPASSVSNLQSPESYTDSMSGGSIPLQHLEIGPHQRSTHPMVIDSHVRSESPNILVGSMSLFSSQLQQENLLLESLATTSSVGHSNLVQLPH